MGSRVGLAVLALAGALAVAALVAIAFFYNSLLSDGGGLPSGGDDLLWVSAVIFVGLVSVAIWLFRGKD